MVHLPGDPSPEPDEFDRSLQRLTSGATDRAAFKEPSAAERARKPVTRTGRTSWRNARKAARLRTPVVEPGKARPGSGRLRTKGRMSAWQGRRARSLLVAVTVLVVLAAAGYALNAFGLRVPPPKQGAVGSRLSTGSQPYTAADPFHGTPAEQYAAGQAGIVLPTALAVGTYSAAQVRAAYTTTKKLLVAANLNPQTLSGGRPRALAALLAPQLRAYFLGNLNRRGVDKNGYDLSTRTWVASFAPGTTALVGSVIKVHGFMGATTAVDSERKVLRITFDYLFVYPVERPGQPSTRMRVVQRQQGDVDFAQWSGNGPLQPWYLPGPDSGPAGARCDVNDGFIHPEFPGGLPDKVPPSGPPVDPYSQSQSPSRAACAATTGT